jgi:folylpolyglutamate synthase/dihydropteroate synthase
MQESNERSPFEPTVLGAMWRFWWVMLVCVNVGAGLGIAYPKLRPASYEAVASFVVQDPQVSSLFGSVSGKKPLEMAEILAPAFDHIVVSKPNAFKPSDPADVREIFHRLNPGTELHEDPARALARARELAGGRPILVTGSFYMVSEIRALLHPEA